MAKSTLVESSAPTSTMVGAYPDASARANVATTYRRIGGLAAPIALANALAVSSQWLIVVLVGRFGADALYVRSLFLPVSFIFAAVLVGIEVSTTVAVARYRADHGDDPQRLSAVVRPIAIVGGAAMIVVAAAIGVGAQQLGDGLGVAPGTGHAFVVFIRMMCLAVLVEVPCMVLTGTLRGWGRSGAASVVSVAMMVVQVIGVATLGGALRLGVAALPWAVVCSAVVGVALGATFLWRFDMLAGAIGRSGEPHSRGFRSVLGVLASVGVPVGGTFVLLCLVNGATLRVLDRFGAAAVSGFAIANATQTVVIVPAMGLGTAVAILVNQCAGANRAAAIGRTVRRGAVIAVAAYATLGALVRLGSGMIARLASPDADVGAAAATHLRVVGPTLACVGTMLAMLTLLEQTGSGFIALTFNICYFGTSVGIGAALANRSGQYAQLFETMAVVNVVAIIIVAPIAAYRVRRLAGKPAAA